MDRRQFLYCSIATVSAAAIGVAVWPEPTSTEHNHDRQLWLIQALVPVVLEGAQSQAQLVQLAPQISADVSAMVATLSPASQQKVNELYTTLDSRLSMLALSGSMVPLLERSPQQRFELLNDWRYHYLDMLKQAYAALREPITAAYWSDSAHWGQLNYQAPSLGVD